MSLLGAGTTGPATLGKLGFATPNHSLRGVVTIPFTILDGVSGRVTVSGSIEQNAGQ